VTGAAVALNTVEADNERIAITRIGRATFDNLRAKSTAAGTVELVRLVSSPTFERMPELLPAVTRTLTEEQTLDRATVLKAGETFNQPGFGEGLARLRSAQPELVDKTVLDGLKSSKDLAGLDRLGATLPADKLAGLTKTNIKTLTESGELAKLDRPGARLPGARLDEIGKVAVNDAPASPVVRTPLKPTAPKVRKPAAAKRSTTIKKGRTK